MKNKILLYISMLAVLSSLLITTNKTYADNCALTIDPSSMAKTQWHDSDGSKTKGGIKVTSNGCFTKGDTTLFLIYPEKEKTWDFSRKDNETIDGYVEDANTFYTTDEYINFTKGNNNIIICAPKKRSEPQSCKNDEKIIIGRSTFPANTGNDPVPTGYSLPKLDPAQQTACIYQKSTGVTIKASALIPGSEYRVWIDNGDGDNIIASAETQDIQISGDNFPEADDKRICIDIFGKDKHVTPQNCLSMRFTTTPPDVDTSCDSTNPNLPNTTEPTPTPGLPACATFAGEGEDGSPRCVEVDTAFGRLNVDGPGIVQSLFGLMLGLGGLVAFILIVYSGFQLLTSQGNPEKIKLARERLTSAIVGLLFIIFSLVILQVIGVDILNLPSFSA